MKILAALLILTVIAAGILGPQFLFVVDETQSAIVTRFGEPQRTIRQPGLKMKSPFIDTVIYFDQRNTLFDAPPDSLLTSDKKRLIIDAYAVVRIIDPLAFYKTVRTPQRAVTRSTDNIASELRKEIGQDEQSQIIKTNRETIMNRVTEASRPLLSDFGLQVVDVRTKRIDFPSEIANSIYERMKAERKRIADAERAEGAERDLEIRAGTDRQAAIIKAEAERDADIVRGEGEAEAITIFAEALEQGPEFYAFRRSLEAYTNALRTGTTLVLSADSELFRYLQSPTGTAQDDQ
jgi:membrane protease subunit HflC